MNKPDQTDRDEQDIARLLRAAGPRQELPAQLKAQWEDKFRAELQPTLDRRRQSRSRMLMSMCAGLAVVAVATWFALPKPGPAQPEIRITHASGAYQLQHDAGDSNSNLREGQQLAPGSTITTGGDGFVAVDFNGYDLRLNHNSSVTLESLRIRALAGSLYVSNEQAATSVKQLLIDTPHGSIRDIGTQFTVTLHPGETITTVRRGAVLIDTDGAQLQATALPNSAAQVSVNDRRQMREARVPGNGRHWNWIYQGTQPFELEGKSAYEFLQWSVAESGLQLQFASTGAEIHASTTLLHGDFGELNPQQAVSPVLATTDLEAKRVGNKLVVSLKINR